MSNETIRGAMMIMRRKSQSRQGKILVLTGLILTLLLGMVALGVDIGWILLSRTQLQAASDSGSLAAGTELISGLGASAYRTPGEVQVAAAPLAVAYVAEHRSGDASSTHIEPARDIQFGKAKFDGGWKFRWGDQPYNAVGVTTRRSSVGTTEGDGPLPLIFAPVLGSQFADVTVDSVAVIMPASGIRIPPGSDLSSGLSPFAFERARWLKYWRARKYFESHGMTASDLDKQNGGTEIMDPEDLDESGNPRPLFYEMVEVGSSGTYRPLQIFDDRYKVLDPAKGGAENIVEEPDGILETNIYPKGTEAGNFGTVDIGKLNNSTSDLSRQIRDGVSESDMEAFENNQLSPSLDSPLRLQGDTGISSGLEAAVEDIVGECRTIVLYSEVNDPGNTAYYTIVEIVGIRVMDVDLSGQSKLLVIQPCSVSDPAAVPDFDEEIGDETTFFTPLILAK